jgi:hypothetical protein
MDADDIGLVHLPHREEHIALFEKLLKAVEAQRGVYFRQIGNR